MERRQFLKIFLGSTVAGYGLVSCQNKGSKKIYPIDSLAVNDFPIHVNSNMDKGHRLFSTIDQLPSENISTDLLIVGGGIAGLTAAYKAKNQDFILCELDEQFGGSSGAIKINNQLHAQGAHYDLAYPENYGSDVLSVLKDLKIITFNHNSKLWEFKDKKHLIPQEREGQCWYNGNIRSEVLPNGTNKSNFLALIEPYQGKMLLPSRLIDSQYDWLNKVSFYDYLNKYLDLTADFLSAIDYQMIDDYGATSKLISALAGIHYYTCRPYYNSDQHVELFSPLEGNYYFINKLISNIDNKEKLFTKHLVYSITQKEDKVQASVVNLEANTIKQISAQKVIYAGQKHALKFINNKLYKQFDSNRYAPWMVMNIELREETDDHPIWQNDFIENELTFLGFVNSKAQNKGGKQVLTAYFCYPENFRQILKDFNVHKHQIIRNAIQIISGYFQKDISPHIENIYVKLMGHAMPIPYPGYLKKVPKVQNNIAFAGVDTGRLPLMFDAMDSGIEAYKAVSH